MLLFSPISLFAPLITPCITPCLVFAGISISPSNGDKVHVAVAKIPSLTTSGCLQIGVSLTSQYPLTTFFCTCVWSKPSFLNVTKS